MVGCSRIPGSHGTAAWQSRNVQRPLLETVQTRASHTTHMHSVHGRRLGVIPSKRAFGAERVRSGSSGTRSFSERYLTNPSNLGSTVVVHVHSRTSFRRCSGSRRGTRRFGAAVRRGEAPCASAIVRRRRCIKRQRRGLRGHGWWPEEDHNRGYRQAAADHQESGEGE